MFRELAVLVGPGLSLRCLSALRCPSALLPPARAQVLVQLLDDAEAFTGGEVRKAIISVPAYFNTKQREATANAGAARRPPPTPLLPPTTGSMPGGLHHPP